MNQIGKKYPRIFSISTVGIRHHNNSDFLIHPLRTDFTGQSGTGKSLLGADLPQLILTAGKFYKSATKPKGDVQRDIYTMPLSKVNFAYAFMNIEVSEGKFIAIGVHIRKSPKQIHPFIIQKNIGLDSEKNPVFKPMDKIIRYKDFISNNEVLSLDNLKTHFDEKKIYLNSYFQKIPLYHKLLFENKTLHIDLSKDENLLKQFANTIQSLSRGEDIDTSGNKFKKFLFHYDDEIENKFTQQAEDIEQSHRKYEQDSKSYLKLSDQKNLLILLSDLKKNRDKAFKERLSNETAYYYQQKQQKEAELVTANKNLFETELGIISINERKIQIEIDTLQNEVDDNTTELKKQSDIFTSAETHFKNFEEEFNSLCEILPGIEKEKDYLKDIFDKIELVNNWLKVYNSIDYVRTKYNTQREYSAQKEKFDQLIEFLKKNNLVKKFEESEYSKSIPRAIELYSERKKELLIQIENVKKLKDIIQNKDPESFAGWAVKESIKLTSLQESLLFHFATLPTKIDSVSNYIPNPEEFIAALKNSVNETDTEFIVNLSGLHYHIKKREKYIFDDPKQLKGEIDKIGANYQTEITKLEKEIKEIDSLSDLLQNNLKYSEEHHSAYLNRSSIESFNEDKSLNLTTEQFNERIGLYQEDVKKQLNERVQKLYKEKLNDYTDKLGKKVASEKNKIEYEKQINSAEKQINELVTLIKQKSAKLISLRTNDLKNIEEEIFAWKNNIKNPYKDEEDDLIKKFKSTYRPFKDLEKLNNVSGDLREEKGKLVELIKSIELELPTLEKSLLKISKEFGDVFKEIFKPELFVQQINMEEIDNMKKEEQITAQKYKSKFDSLIELYAEELKDNPKMKNHEYNFNQLVLELISPEIITNKDNPEESLSNDIESRLAELHQKIKELNEEEAKKIYSTVRQLKNIIETQTNFLDRIKALLKDFKLASYNKVTLEWKYSDEFNLNWIKKLNEDISGSSFTDNLFGQKTKVSAQELLEAAFKKYCPTKVTAKAHEILNPFNYYDASAIITDPDGKPSPGSTGQNYGMLALLCIAKLSIVEGKNKLNPDNTEPGLRILPIDEVAGLGENFDMLYEIAQKLDYQIFTMTIAANDLAFENNKQIYYEFIKSSDESRFEYNEGIQATFSKYNTIHDVATHFADSIFKLEKQ